MFFSSSPLKLPYCLCLLSTQFLKSTYTLFIFLWHFFGLFTCWLGSSLRFWWCLPVLLPFSLCLLCPLFVIDFFHLYVLHFWCHCLIYPLLNYYNLPCYPLLNSLLQFAMYSVFDHQWKEQNYRRGLKESVAFTAESERKRSEVYLRHIIMCWRICDDIMGRYLVQIEREKGRNLSKIYVH